jgi:hypothetical protein
MVNSRLPKQAFQYQLPENELLESPERDRKLKITLGFKRTGLKTDPYLCSLKRRGKNLREWEMKER